MTSKQPTLTPSLRKAINAKCKDCIYDPLSGLGTWRQQTEACPAKTCPLWPVRPVSRPHRRDSAAEIDSEAAGNTEKATPAALEGEAATWVATP